MEVNISPGRRILNIDIQRSSANKNVSLSESAKTKIQTGTTIRTVRLSPAVMIFLTRSGEFSALYFVISLETVIGVPEQVNVRISAKTDSAT